MTTDKLPEFRFSLESQKARELPYGWAKQATVNEFPVSKNIAGVLMSLKPGGLRELHWHANAAEWGYVISGNARTTIFDPQGRNEINEFKAGDIWFFPRGHGHSIEGLGPDGTTFMLVFDNGAFSDFATFSITDWLSQTPVEIVSKNLQVDESALKGLPGKEAYIVKANERVTVKELETPPLTHKYELLSQEPAKDCEGGKLWIVTSDEFPISSTMSGGVLLLKPGALRELHWHPNADEWVYVLSGKARLTVFASSGMSSVAELGANDIGYTPMGYGHSIENTGEEECRLLVVFNSGKYEEISLSAWLASNPPEIVSANLNLSPETVKGFAKEESFILSRKRK